MEELQNTLIINALNVVGAIIILLVGYYLARLASTALKRYCDSNERLDKTVATLMVRMVFYLILVITLIAVLDRFGFQVTSLVALLGASVLAIGLALQGTLSNVAAGVMILVLRPFKNGEVVKVNGNVYMIDEIGLMMSKAHEMDGPLAFIPNSRLWGTEIVNMSNTYNDMRRINEIFGISYADDIDKAIGIINRLLDEDERVLAEPARLVEVVKLNDSSVDIIVWAWTQRLDWWATKLALTRKIKQAFDAEGVVIPFPQRDVHLHQVEKAST